MDKKSLAYKINLLVFCLVAFTIPLHKKIVPPLIIVLVISTLFNLKFNPIRKNTLWLSGIYILYIIGLFFSTNIKFGLNDVVLKLSLILMPLIVVFSKIDVKKEFKNISSFFVVGTLLSSVIGIGVGVTNYYQTNDIANLFYHKVSIFHHPSYIAMFVCFAIAIIYKLWFSSTISIKIAAAPLIVLTIYGVLLSSKAGLLALVLVHVVAVLYWVLSKKKYLFGLAMLIGLFLSLSVVYKFSRVFRNRVNETFSIVKTYKKNDHLSSSQIRVEIWNVAKELVIKQPLGYGTGDGKDELLIQYEKHNLVLPLEKQLNAHNQFLQTMLCIGIIGGLYLLFTLLIPLFFAIKNKEHIYLTFILLIITNFMFEAMLETQSGVVFYAFFSAILLGLMLEKNKPL